MLNPGTKLGPYEVQSALGAGGMGEVYKARDMRLDRTVAIKVLPPALAADPQFRERFDREARAISSLDHPHICALYDVGEEQGALFLVMQYLEGETLADRLAGAEGLRPKRGSFASGGGAPRAVNEAAPLPLPEALTFAIQIASALDHAHRAGITHRDLKPGNVFLCSRGPTPARARHPAFAGGAGRGRYADEGVSAKLLDFGLAKTSAPAIVDGGASMLPTTPPSLTAQGTILGTLQYMAPEQIEGLDADARTDIFAFGAVLYEMLTGRKAFEGKTRASLLGAILKDTPPPISTLQPLAPRALSRIVTTCLAKEPDDRWQTARDLHRELKWLTEAGADAGDASAASPASIAVRPAGWPRALPWAVATALSVGLVLGLVLWAPWRKAPPSAPMRLEATLGADASLVADQGAAAILSPDGKVLAFVAQKSAGGSSPQLYVRRLEQLQAAPLSGTDEARNPFFSPDGQWIAFFAGGKLKKISVTGGAAVTLCDAPNGRGGAWAEDGTILFSPNNVARVSLLRVSSAGGKPEPLTTLDQGEVTQRWPQVLPGGKAVLYSSASSLNAWNDGNLVVQPLPTGTRKTVLRGGYYGRYLPSGHLAYIREGTLFAAPFDLDRLEVTGPSAPALEGVTGSPGVTGGAQFAATGDGTLLYLPGQSLSRDAPIVWMNGEGKTTPLRRTPTNWANPRFAPDGRQLAMYINDGKQSDVWVYDWTRDTLSRFTFDAADDIVPVWTPDGRRIAFASMRADKSTFNLYWQRADGTGEVQRLTESKNNQYATSWHPSGTFLAFRETNPQTGDDLMILPMEGDEASGWKPGKPTVFLNSPFLETFPTFSPDGRWLAYSSNESGRYEVYVRPFPGPGGKWQVSASGGGYPAWSRTRHELLYQTLAPEDRIMVASYTVEGASFRVEKPRLWADREFAERPLGWDFDLHPDGERVALAPKPEAQAATKQDKVVFIFNFFDELKRLAPPKK